MMHHQPTFSWRGFWTSIESRIRSARWNLPQERGRALRRERVGETTANEASGFLVVLRKILQFHCWMDGRRRELGLAGSTGMGPADRNLDDTKISLGCMKET